MAEDTNEDSVVPNIIGSEHLCVIDTIGFRFSHFQAFLQHTVRQEVILVYYSSEVKKNNFLQSSYFNFQFQIAAFGVMIAQWLE